MAVKPVILVVDDNPATRYSTTRVLKGADFEIVEAASGAEALALVKKADLVVLDVHLPDFDGFEVCKRIRLDPTTQRTPVVHLSATFVKDVHKVRGLDAGADGYLTHPVEPPVLVATVSAFLRAREAEEALTRSEAKFRAVFEHALNGIALLSSDLVCVEANPAFCNIVTRDRANVVGKHLSTFIPADRPAIFEELKTSVAETGSWRGQLPLVNRAGDLVHLEWSLSTHSVPNVFLAIVTDISDRIRSENERNALLDSERVARAVAEKANGLKDEFLATLSHELRTPLNAILGHTQLYHRAPFSQEQTNLSMSVIERNARVQVQLINDLLDVSRINSGKLLLEDELVEPGAVLEAALETTKSAAEAKKISIVRNFESRDARVRGDFARLQQIFWNLLTNAVKFTPAGGVIRCSLTLGPADVFLSVSDSGQGIEKDFLTAVFDRFRQVDSSTTRRHGGLGLGLAIVKHLVELHNGTISVESPGLGKGATFSVTLPRIVSPSTAGFDPIDPTAARSFHDSASQMLKDVRVLVVDDDADARDVIRRVLEFHGALVSEVGGVDPALEVVQSGNFDLLITDIGMPSKDGYELLREIRKQPLTQDLLAIALTAFARQEDKNRALANGFQLHLSKPLEPRVLVDAVAGLIARRGLGATGS